MMHGSGARRRVSNRRMSTGACERSNVSKFLQIIAQPKIYEKQGTFREVMFRIAWDRSDHQCLDRERCGHDAVSIGPLVPALPERLDPSPRPAGPDRGQQKQLRNTFRWLVAPGRGGCSVLPPTSVRHSPIL
jgi:hypothetical protein